MLQEDDELLQNVDEIFVEPPEPNVDTDEDSANEDEGGNIYNLNGKIRDIFPYSYFIISNVAGRQLRAPAEIKLANNDRIDRECSGNNRPDDNVSKI